jgi:hypothetical protein
MQPANQIDSGFGLVLYITGYRAVGGGSRSKAPSCRGEQGHADFIRNETEKLSEDSNGINIQPMI